jgi:hypothetical protein
MHNQQATIAGRAQPTDERRGAHRQRIFKGGVLRFNRGYGALECVVRDVSERGALLVFGDTAAVPSQFDLRVGPAGEWRAASVRWRRDTRVGVSFE